MQSKSESAVKYIVRPPIVSVMGHVDHGKTTLLDSIRKTKVAEKEYAGITQHIGAYQVEYKGSLITFIDTPGHEAFSTMRARGGKVADIVVLVVSGVEGVMPQTKEAIAHAKAGGAKIIVAINKCDLTGFDAQKVKKDLAEEGVLVEDWGGDVICVECSAKTGINLDCLLDAIVVQAQVLELKANPQGELEALIIESRLDAKRGPVVTAIVRDGTLRLGMEISAGKKSAKVKSLYNFLGQSIESASPGTPVEILGFKEVPNVGDTIVQKGSELESLTEDENRVEVVGKNTKNKVSVVIRSDTFGTLEAIKASLAKMAVESPVANFSLEFLSSGTGDITHGDILLAESAKGLVLGFNVRVSNSVADLAQNHNVKVATFKTIYELTDFVEQVLSGAVSTVEAKIKGRAEVVKLFKLDSGDIILGCRVLAGTLKEGSAVEIYDKNPSDLKKEDEPLYTGVIKNLKEGKQDVTMVSKGKECGVLLKPLFAQAQAGYYIEVK